MWLRAAWAPCFSACPSRRRSSLSRPSTPAPLYLVLLHSGVTEQPHVIMNVEVKEGPCKGEAAVPPSAAAKWPGKGDAGPGALTTLPPCLGDNEIVEAVVLEPGTEKPWLMTRLGLSHPPAGPQAGRRPRSAHGATPARAKDPEQSGDCPEKPPGTPKPRAPPNATLPRAWGERRLTWGMIRSSLMYMSCSTPADLRDKGRRAWKDEEAASQGDGRRSWEQPRKALRPAAMFGEPSTSAQGPPGERAKADAPT